MPFPGGRGASGRCSVWLGRGWGREVWAEGTRKAVWRRRKEFFSAFERLGAKRTMFPSLSSGRGVVLE